MFIKDGSEPGVNDDAKQTSEGDGTAAGESGNDEIEGDDAGKTPKANGRFYTQDEIDKIISKRVARATKDADDKAKLTKEQLLERERDDALSQVRERDLKDDFVQASGIDPGRSRRVFAMFRDEIETDDKGKATNMKEVIKMVKTEFPEMFKGPLNGGADAGGGEGDGGKPIAGDMNNILRKMAGRK